MAIYVKTSTPRALVQKINQDIHENKIQTWTVDKDGDYTHAPEQWRNRAWIRPHIEEGRVVFGALCRKDANMTVNEYAVFHGRFVEMLLDNFDHMCMSIEVTPLGTKYDSISIKK